jgi:hypothetical protein
MIKEGVMEKLTIANAQEFTTIFYDFFDGLVHKIYFDLNNKSKLDASVEVLVQKQQEMQSEKWVIVTFKVSNVIEIILLEGNHTCLVLSGGLKIGFFGSSVYLDFCPYTEDPDGIEDFLRSHFLVAGESCEWFEVPYSDPT